MVVSDERLVSIEFHSAEPSCSKEQAVEVEVVEVMMGQALIVAIGHLNVFVSKNQST